MRFIDSKFRKKHGNNSWKHRPYHDCKGCGSDYELMLQFRKESLDKRIKDRIFYAHIRKPNFQEIVRGKYPKLCREFTRRLNPVEFFVLGKHQWRV